MQLRDLTTATADEALGSTRRKALAGVGVVMLALGVPGMMGGSQVAGLTEVLTIAMALLSLNVLLGYTGQISLGQAAFVSAGGYLGLNIAARLSTEGGGAIFGFGVVLLTVFGAALGVAAITTLVGLPSLRIRGLQVAIGTLAFAVAAENWLFKSGWFSGESAGLFINQPFGRGPQYRFYVFGLAMLALVIFLDTRLLRSRLGRGFVTVRDAEERAVAFGVDPGPSKLAAYALSGFMAGLAGAVSLVAVGPVDAVGLVLLSITYLAYVVLGGIGSRAGVLAVAFLLLAPQKVGLFESIPVIRNAFDPSFITLVSGLLLIGIVIFLPSGYGGLLTKQRQQWRGVPVAARAGLTLAGGIALIVLMFLEHSRRTGEVQSLVPDASAPLYPLLFALLAIVVAVGVYLVLLFSDPGDPPAIEVEGALATGEAAIEQAKTSAAAARELRDVGRDMSIRMPTRALFEATDVSIRFGGVQALKSITMEVREGEIVGLIGANGAGKSTFYNCVSGFVTPQEGSIKYRGQELLSASPTVRTRMGVGRTFQHMGLLRPETVEDNVLLAQHWLADYNGFAGITGFGGVKKTEIELRRRAELALQIFGLDHLRHVKLGSLPYGTMRMVELAAQVSTGADLLFFDEASAGLGPDEAHALGDRYLALRDQLGLSLVVIEHHVPLIARSCDYVYCLASGEQLAEGRPADVQTDPRVIAEFLGRAQISGEGGVSFGDAKADEEVVPA